MTKLILMNQAGANFYQFQNFETQIIRVMCPLQQGTCSYAFQDV